MNIYDQDQPREIPPSKNDYDDDNIPEIDTPKESTVVEDFPAEFPIRKQL